MYKKSQEDPDTYKIHKVLPLPAKLSASPAGSPREASSVMREMRLLLDHSGFCR